MGLAPQRKGLEVGEIHAMGYQVSCCLVIRMSHPSPGRTIPIWSQHNGWPLLPDNMSDLHAVLKIIYNPAILKIHDFHIVQPQNLGSGHQFLSTNLRGPATAHFADSKVHDSSSISPVF